MRAVNCDIYGPDGNGLPAGSPVYARLWSDKVGAVQYSGLVMEDHRLIFKLEDCADTGGANIEVIAPGCKVWSGRGFMNLGSEEGPRIDLEEGDNPFRKPSEAAGVLGVNGQFFTLNGQPWTAIQASAFNLFGRYLDGEDIKPFLIQHQALGFNLLRVWTRYDLVPYGIGRLTLSDHPDLYEKVPSFLALCARYGLFVEFTAYTGREDFDPDHWNRLGEASKTASTLPLLELVNENDQAGNHIDTSLFSPIVGILCSHGSNGSEQQPVLPHWDYATFHTNGASEWQRKNGHNAMEIWGGPTLTNEATRAPDQDSTVIHFHDAAAGAALLCAGSCFHSVSGKAARMLDGNEIPLAQAHCQGARSVDLACQVGPYTHRQDLEKENILRAYERPVPGHNGIVLIRT